MGDVAVWVEKTGRTVDGVARAVRAWADSKKCDYRRGAGLVELQRSVLEHHRIAARGAEPVDFTTRALSALLKRLSAAGEKLERLSDIDGHATSRPWAGSLTITIRPQALQAGAPPPADAPPPRAETPEPPEFPPEPPSPPPPPPPPRSPPRAARGAVAARSKRGPPTIEPSPVKATATQSGRTSRCARHGDGS
mmetsp:Transcript_27174/g.97085  ORF Transcript_27174/g.97085 Transcript_27174/m.97085 type:complete len:194 (+) Transcript_27174:60-641(+)